MNARDWLYERLVGACIDPERATTELDAHRQESIGAAIARLRAIPVACTALTGPVWYGAGWNDCIRTLEEISDYRLPDDEAYPGELQRLRALNLGLRAALLRRDDSEWARQQLTSHAKHEAQARSGEAKPDFFQPGHMYLYARMQWKFRCDAVTSHPDTGKRVAVGYSGFGPSDWQTSDLSEGVWADGDWTDITETGQAPVPEHYDRTPDPLDGCHWCACGNRWPCDAPAVTG